MKTTIDGRLFEWDDAKNKINKIKHGINFKTAAKVFNSPTKTKAEPAQLWLRLNKPEVKLN